MTRVLFVCLGNICRSPAAEGIFRVKAKELGVDVETDSAGTGGWHVNHPPDARMIEHAKERGYDISDLRGRQIQAPKDFEKFDLILTMDDSNFQNVANLDPEHRFKGKLHKMTSFCKMHSVSEVPDPYYKEEDGFRLVLDILEDACTELLTQIKMGKFRK